MTEPHLATQAGPAMRRPTSTPAEPAATGGAPGQSWRSRALVLLRRHWLVAALLAAGLVLRVLAEIAYHPALIYVDTLKYLYGESPGADPQGYMLVLRAILAVGDLGTVVTIQHLLGLALAAALYAAVLRRGASRWLAAVAVAPVLLDAYQVQIEQTIMPDVWFEAMIVAALVLLLWRPAVTVRFAAAAGLILGASATMRQLGEVMVLPAVVYLLVLGGGWRQAVRSSAALAAAFALPVVAYCSVSYARTGNFWLARGQVTTGRVAAAADCATLTLPAAVRPLCPTPKQQALGPDWLEHSGHSPLYQAAIPPGADRLTLISELTSAIVRQQPLRVVVSVARDSVRVFSVTRTSSLWIAPIWRWQFQTSYPTYLPWISVRAGNVITIGVQRVSFGQFYYHPLRPSYGGRAQVDRPVAAFLRAYQLDGGYTPGPLLALFALAGLAGSVVTLIHRPTTPRSRQLALGCLLFTAFAAVLLLPPDVFEFSWRYQLPVLISLPPAGVLGLAALLSRRRPAAQPGPDPAPGSA
ncbi:MAG TPA: hypothetical protein VMV92_36265 [Streptosporangiaceae bacterium]|nr:hypothetical protein [Streptosporangiaceae bacterium]